MDSRCSLITDAGSQRARDRGWGNPKIASRDSSAAYRRCPGNLARPEHSDKHDVASIRIPIRLNVQLLL